MALNTLPGFTGFQYARVSSLDQRAIGRFTDTNHLESLHSEAPADYDKKLITLYTQSSLYANDFLTMLNDSTPFLIKGNTDAFQYDIQAPYRQPKLVAVPADTYNQARIGIDEQTFQLVFDKQDFSINQIITADKMYGQQFVIVKEAEVYNSGWLYTLTLVTLNPATDFVDKRWLNVGVEYEVINITTGEFTQDLPGLPGFGDKYTMYESLGSGLGAEHSITGWADDRTLRDAQTGNPLDLIMYVNRRTNETPITKSMVKWEPFVEAQLKIMLLSMKVGRMIWAKPGTAKERGTKQEVKKISAGVYYRMKYNGNYLSYPRGSFTPTIFRTVFGDLFYRRVDISRRRVRIFTNEAGWDQFSEAVKTEAFNNSSFSFNVGEGNRFIRGSGQNLVLDYAFSGMVTRETGEITLSHLRELDLPQNSTQYGQNLKSTPIYMVFDVSPDGDGSLKGNIREVRMEGRPSMTWGYIDGRRHHLGFAASKGHSAGQKLDAYTIFMDDRYDVFVEDLSRCVLIEEEPAF